MKTLPVVASLSCAGVCSVGWYGFQSLQPKNLKEYLEWQGFKLVTSAEDPTWDSILKEREEVATRVVGSKDKTSLKKWCDEHTPLVKFNDHIQNAIDLCVYNVKTVKGKLVQNKKDLNAFLTGQTNNDEKYKVSYAFRKHNEDFLKLIGHTPEEDEGAWNPAIDKYKEWCQNSLESEFKDSVYESFLIFCMLKNFSTVKAYLSGRTLLTEDSQKEELKKVHQKISNFDSYKADNIESGEEGLKKWCTENLGKNFSDSLDVLDEILPKVISRCVRGSEITDK